MTEGDRQTDKKHMDIATTRPKWPKGRFGEKYETVQNIEFF